MIAYLPEGSISKFSGYLPPQPLSLQAIKTNHSAKNSPSRFFREAKYYRFPTSEGKNTKGNENNENKE